MPFIDYRPFAPEGYDGEAVCHDPGHDPPTHMVLKPGVHTWECPACGHKQKLIVRQPIN